MKIFESKYAPWLLLLVPVFMLVVDVAVSRRIGFAVRGVLLNEKLHEASTAIDMISSLVESKLLRGTGDIEESIVGAVNYLDRVEQVYCAAYFEADNGGGLVLISDRYAETSIFEPFEYDLLTEQINTCDSGNAIIGYTPENQSFRELHVYFRWITSNGGRYLILAGVSEHAIKNQLDFWAATGGYSKMMLTLMFWNALVAYVVLSKAFKNGNGKKKITFKNESSLF